MVGEQSSRPQTANLVRFWLVTSPVFRLVTHCDFSVGTGRKPCAISSPCHGHCAGTVAQSDMVRLARNEVHIACLGGWRVGEGMCEGMCGCATEKRGWHLPRRERAGLHQVQVGTPMTAVMVCKYGGHVWPEKLWFVRFCPEATMDLGKPCEPRSPTFSKIHAFPHIRNLLIFYCCLHSQSHGHQRLTRWKTLSRLCSAGNAFLPHPERRCRRQWNGPGHWPTH
jgi:hypothetical protein